MTSLKQDENKTCRYCAESIPARAKVCPRCRQWLTFRSFRNPVVILFTTILPFLAMQAIFLLPLGNIVNPPPYYSDFRGSIQILNSNMNWAETTDGSRVYLTGLLTNQSKIAWKDPEFECRFYDSKGQMVDAMNGTAYLTVLPGADSAFRVAVKPLLSSNNYTSFRISASNARNVRSF
jgi:hypothetical protein